MLDSLSPYLPAARIERIPVAYSPADVPGFAHDTAARRNTTVVCEVITVGQFIDRNGPWILLAGAQQLLRDGADLRFVWICGTPPAAARQRARTQFDPRQTALVTMAVYKQFLLNNGSDATPHRPGHA